MTPLESTLKRLDAEHGKKQASKRKPLKVYYGWAKLNAIQKREALTVIFLNDETPPRINKDGMDGVTKYMTPVYCRNQTIGEMKDAKSSNRQYTVYSIFMDDKRIAGSLANALRENYNDDVKNVNPDENMKIYKALHDAYMLAHPDYKEPQKNQLELNF